MGLTIKFQLIVIASIFLLHLCSIEGTAFAFESEVTLPGSSISLTVSTGQTILESTMDNRKARAASNLTKGLSLEYRKRSRELQNIFYQLNFEQLSWDKPNSINRITADSKYAFSFFYGRRSSSKKPIWFGYSAGMSQQFFVKPVRNRSLDIESHWTFHARLFTSIALIAPRFGNYAAVDTRIPSKDSPKVRLEAMVGALSPYHYKTISPYWGWETSGKLSYGNSLQWMGITYYRSHHDSPVGQFANYSLRLELSLSLDKPKSLEDGAGW